MKRVSSICSFMVVFAVIGLSSCNFGKPPVQVVETQPPTTGSLSSLDSQTEVPATLVEVPIDLAGPPMEVGSFYTYVDGSILAAVPAGPFLMGYDNYADTTEHTVTVGDYWIYTNEVTNKQFELCVELGKCSAPDPVDNPFFQDYRYVSYPVTGVNYQQAADYCSFVHGRLPTEAEWEKAARGPDGNLFPWGNEAPVCDLLNFDFCKGKTVDVKSYPHGVSYYGLFDMSGNIREWVADWYTPEYIIGTESTVDPLGPELGEKRSIRSSSFEDSADSAISAHRFSLKPINHLPDVGFRCLVEDPTFYAPFCEGLTLYGADINGNPVDVVHPVSPGCEQAGGFATQGGCQSGESYITINPWPNPGGDPVFPGSCIVSLPNATCTGSGDVIIPPQDCTWSPPSGAVPSCSPGYSPGPGTDSSNISCKGQGPGVNCPDGYELDPLLNCCSAVNQGPNDYLQCVSFDQIGTDCYYDPGVVNLPQLVSIHFDAPPSECGGNDTPCDPSQDPTCGTCDPQDPNCQPPTNSCGTYPNCSRGCHQDTIKLACVPN